MTKPFCGSCGRVRLTSDGKLYPCLLDDRFADLRPAWDDGAFNCERAGELIRTVIRDKRPEGGKRQSAAMVSLGG
jgi:cyclic pyranopterin phosphate synthase